MIKEIFKLAKNVTVRPGIDHIDIDNSPGDFTIKEINKNTTGNFSCYLLQFRPLPKNWQKSLSIIVDDNKGPQGNLITN